jgi:hypothetical protein
VLDLITKGVHHMKVTLLTNSVEVGREAMDGRLSSPSQFFFRLRQALNGQQRGAFQPSDAVWIKRLMSQDGHMVSEGVHYVRTRKPVQGRGGDGLYDAIWDEAYAVRDISTDFNGLPIGGGVVFLQRTEINVGR